MSTSVEQKAAQDRHRRPGAGIRQYGLRALVVLFILNAVDEFDRAVLAVALDEIRVDFGVSDATVGLLPLAVIFIIGILSLPAGAWSDRYSRTRIIAGGSAVWGSAGLLAAVSPNFITLFLTRAMLGAGQGTIGPTHFSLLSDYYPVHVRGRVLGYHRSANPFGQVIGALVGGAIIGAAGWRWGFAAAAVPGLLLGMYALTLREPRRGESDIATAVDGNPMLAEFLREPADHRGFVESLGAIFGNRTLRYLIFTNAAFGFMLFGIVFWLPALFERRYDFTTTEASAAFGALALAAFFGTWFGGPLADRIVQRGFHQVAWFGVVATVVLAASWTAGFAIPVAAATLLLITGGAFLAALGVPGITALVAACSPPRIRGQAFAAFGLALAVCGAAAAPLIVGLISETLQRWPGLDEGEALRYAILAATSTVGCLGAWLMYQAGRTAAADVQRTLADFIAEFTAKERTATG